MSSASPHGSSPDGPPDGPPAWPRAITSQGHVEPVARRIRAVLAGETVFDTTRALYVWHWPHYPQYHVPAADFAPGVLRDAGGPHRLSLGTATPVDLSAGAARRPRAGRRYREATRPELVGTVHLDWDAVDAWYEEDERVFVHPRSPYVRVDALRSRRRVRVSCDGVLLADSDAPVMVFETGLPTRCYLDPATVDLSRLELSGTVTECPYKGRTSATWSVRIGDAVHPDLAWRYDFPTRQLTPIAGLIAFYDEQVDVTVDGVAQPRPRTHLASD